MDQQCVSFHTVSVLPVLARKFPYNSTQRHTACVSGGGGPVYHIIIGYSVYGIYDIWYVVRMAGLSKSVFLKSTQTALCVLWTKGTGDTLDSCMPPHGEHIALKAVCDTMVEHASIGDARCQMRQLFLVYCCGRHCHPACGTLGHTIAPRGGL